MSYVDGFVLPVPKKNLAAYRAQATKAGKVWMDHGALSYVENVADDVPYGELTSFPRAVMEMMLVPGCRLMVSSRFSRSCAASADSFQY